MDTDDTPRNEKLKEQTLLVRTVEAALAVAVPDEKELRFRESLLRCAADKAKGFPYNFVVRLYEAACDVKFPAPHVTAFRHALQDILGRTMELKKYRATAAAQTGQNKSAA